MVRTNPHVLSKHNDTATLNTPFLVQLPSHNFHRGLRRSSTSSEALKLLSEQAARLRNGAGWAWSSCWAMAVVAVQRALPHSFQ